MEDPSKRDKLLIEFESERSIRRAAKLLQEKRSRIRDDLKQLINHLTLLVPLSVGTNDNLTDTDILIAAAHRLNDELFAEMLIQMIKESQNL